MAVIYAKNKTTGEWERVSPETAVIDPTLSIEGAPADAKATGDALEEIRNQIDNISDNISFDGLATEEYVDSKFDEVSGQVSTKQDALTFDATPTDGSTNPVTSEGIKAYVDSKEFVLPEGYPINNRIVIEWDGDTTDKVCVESSDGKSGWYKVSDIILSDEEIRAGNLTGLTPDGEQTVYVDDSIWEQYVNWGYITEDVVFIEAFIVARKDGATLKKLTLPESGVYFTKSDDVCTTRFETGTVTTMSPTLLPSDIAYKPYVDEQIANHNHDAKYDAKGAAAAVKNDLLNGAGEAYDTLKELGNLIDENVDAIDALEIIASGKANISDLPIIKYSNEGIIRLTWDGEIGDKDNFAFGTWTYCKQSSMAPEYSGVTSGYTFRSNGMQNTNIVEGVNCYAVGDAIVVTAAGTCSKGGTQFNAPSTGIYLSRMSGWYTEEFEMDCDISYTSLFTTDVNGTQHVIAVDENNLLSVTDTSNDSTVYMATTGYVDGKLNEIAKPDWNESDPDGKAYILNKPFYEISEEKVIISNKQRTMSETSGTSTNSYYINYNNSIIDVSTYSFIAEGQQCKLLYTLNNGSTVEITGNAKHYSANSGYQYEYYVFGNQYLLNGLTSPSVATNLGSDINSGENTAVIFAIAYYDGEILTPNCCIYVVTTDVGMQTVSLVLSVVDSDVVQLDEKFIPNNIQRVISGTQGQVVGFDESGNAVAEDVVSEIFIATINSTTFAEVEAAHDAGKTCFCRTSNGNGVFMLVTCTKSTITFSATTGEYQRSYQLTTDDVWTSYPTYLVDRAGDTMTGALTLAGDPTEALHAATKQYVDIRVPAWTEADEGKVLKIINGVPTWANIEIASADDGAGNVVIS